MRSSTQMYELLRLSIRTTLYPALSSSRVVWEPIYPRPPVTRIYSSFGVVVASTGTKGNGNSISDRGVLEPEWASEEVSGVAGCVEPLFGVSINWFCRIPLDDSSSQILSATLLTQAWGNCHAIEDLGHTLRPKRVCSRWVTESRFGGSRNIELDGMTTRAVCALCFDHFNMARSYSRRASEQKLG